MRVDEYLSKGGKLPVQATGILSGIVYLVKGNNDGIVLTIPTSYTGNLRLGEKASPSYGFLEVLE